MSGAQDEEADKRSYEEGSDDSSEVKARR